MYRVLVFSHRTGNVLVDHHTNSHRHHCKQLSIFLFLRWYKTTAIERFLLSIVVLSSPPDFHSRVGVQARAQASRCEQPPPIPVATKCAAPRQFMMRDRCTSGAVLSESTSPRARRSAARAAWITTADRPGTGRAPNVILLPSWSSLSADQGGTPTSDIFFFFF
jgi:hypothetical protein